MTNQIKKLKVLDVIVIIVVGTVSLFFMIFTWNIGGQKKFVRIETPGGAYQYDLNKNQILEINGKCGTTVIEIKNSSVRFVSSACPAKTCVNVGAIKKANIPIVCIPNGVSAYITGGEEFDDISR